MRCHSVLVMMLLAFAAAVASHPQTAAAQQCGMYSYQAEIARQLLEDNTRGAIEGCANGKCLSTNRRTVATLTRVAQSTNELWLCTLSGSQLTGCGTPTVLPVACDDDSCGCSWTECVDGTFAAACAGEGFTEIACYNSYNDDGTWAGWGCECKGGGGGDPNDPISSQPLQPDTLAQAQARRTVADLYEVATGEPVAELDCGGGPGISPGIQSWYGCSHNGKLCYVNISVNNTIDSGDCTPCGNAKGQISCTPWDD